MSLQHLDPKFNWYVIGRAGPGFSDIISLTMTRALSANMEMAIALPLGVVANQLMRIEANLRLLNTTVADFAEERDDGSLTGLISDKLDNINELLHTISRIVSNLEADIQTGIPDVPVRKPRPDHDD
jgi:hypothetical protein